MTTPTAIYPDIYNPDLENGTDLPPSVGSDLRAPDNIRHKRLYLALGYLFRNSFNLLQASGGSYPATDPTSFPNNFSDQDRNRFLSVFGQLLMNSFDDPSLGRLERGFPGPRDIFLNGKETDSLGNVVSTFGKEPIPDPSGVGWQWIDFRVLIVPEFVAQFQESFRHYTENNGIFDQVFVELQKQAVGKAAPGSGSYTINARDIAAVGERLIVRNVSPSDPYISLQIQNALAQTLGGVIDGAPSSLSIDPPDLDTVAAIEIIPDNVRAVRMIYYSSQLEEMKLHAVYDKVFEHFHVGLLPITRGEAADKMYQYFKKSALRLNEMERRALYGRCLGLAQGNVADVMPNREFSTLWMRFLSTVSQKYREVSSFERDQVSVEQVHKSARDLAVNASLHGYGLASPAAGEMKAIIEEIFSIFDEKEVQMAYGVRDRWQLVDRVANLYLAGASNGVKYRTLAATGEKIINWLAESAPVLASGSAAGLNIVAWSGDRRIPTPAFTALSEWCERWLAATGTSDAVMAQNTAPLDLKSQLTVPMLGQSTMTGMPQAVQDALNQVRGSGVNVPLPNLPSIPQA